MTVVAFVALQPLPAEAQTRIRTWDRVELGVGIGNGEVGTTTGLRVGLQVGTEAPLLGGSWGVGPVILVRGIFLGRTDRAALGAAGLNFQISLGELAYAQLSGAFGRSTGELANLVETTCEVGVAFDHDPGKPFAHHAGVGLFGSWVESVEADERIGVVGIFASVSLTVLH